MAKHKAIYFILTEKCNFSCGFCIRKNIELESEMNSENGLKILEKLSTYYPDSVLILTGGEPFLHPKWEVFLRLASQLFSKVVITSNGSFSETVSNILSSYLDRNVFLQISIDGPSEIHDDRRRNGAYKLAIENIRRLQKNSNHISISTTVSKKTLSYLSDWAESLNKESFSFWKVSQEQLISPSIESLITNEDWNAFVDSIIVKSTHPVLVSKLFDFALIERLLNDKQFDKCDIIRNCGYGIDKMYITPSFNVMPCSCVDIVLGNLLTDDFSEIEAGTNRLCTVKLDVESACINCSINEWCNGGCPGYSIKVFKKIGMGDIRCPYVQKHLI